METRVMLCAGRLSYLVVLSPEKPKSAQSQDLSQVWRKDMGLALQTSQTRIVHPLRTTAGAAGFDCLGFHISSYPTQRTRLGFKTLITPSQASGKTHQRQFRELIARHKMVPPAALIQALNGGIRGWRQDCSPGWSKDPYSQADGKRVQRRRSWGRVRHPQQPRREAARKDWRRQGNTWHFAPSNSATR